MRFVADQAGSHWRGSEGFGTLCERAGLSVDQAEVALLAVSGLTLASIAGVLASHSGGPIRYRQVRTWAWNAEKRLQRAYPRLVACHRQEALDLISCLRNVRHSNPPPAVYPERWFGYDRDPVTLRARLVAAEDLTSPLLRFLRDLPRVLRPSAARAERESEHAR